MRSSLFLAKKFLARRDFSNTIRILKSSEDQYEDNFDFFLTAAIAFLYEGFLGDAATYIKKARAIKITEPTLLLTQAALFLRRGDTRRAIQYYLEVLDISPNEKTANNALKFLQKTSGKENRIREWAETGKLKKFYPPLGFNFFLLFKILFSIFFGAIIGVIVFFAFRPKPILYEGKRRNLSDLALLENEKKNLQQNDFSQDVILIVMNDEEILETWRSAIENFQNNHDNFSRYQINRILNSNATPAIKQKAKVLSSYLEEPNFNTLLDNFSYAEIQKNPILYLDCWVDWTGTIANFHEDENFYEFELFIGYESSDMVEGIVPVRISKMQTGNLDKTRAVRILAKITLEENKFFLEAKSQFQPLQWK